MRVPSGPAPDGRVRRLKAAELVAALAACAGFLAGSVPLLFLALAGFGTVSALFGPAKYAVLPDHLKAGAVPMANAAIEGSTFLAILGRGDRFREPAPGALRRAERRASSGVARSS